MNNKDIIAKIKAEIERLKKAQEVSEDKDRAQYELDVACGYDMACDDILSFISTLESEKPVPADLEEAAEEYAYRGIPEEIKPYVKHIAEQIIKNFIAGAKWQAEQDKETIELAEDHAFLAGADWQKEQMMKEAVSGWLDEDNEPPYDLNVVCEEKIPFGKFKHGDKIRIIIVKED